MITISWVSVLYIACSVMCTVCVVITRFTHHVIMTFERNEVKRKRSLRRYRLTIAWCLFVYVMTVVSFLV